MSWTNIPPDRRVELLNAKRKGELTAADAEKYDMPFSTLKRRLREMDEEGRELAAARLTTAVYAASPERPRYKDYIVLEEDNVLISSDWEFPDTDPEMLVRLLLTAIRYQIRTLVIVGDAISGDQDGLSTWAELVASDDNMSFSTAIGSLRSILHAMGEWFDRIIITSGNHDERVQKATSGQIHLGMLLKHINPNVEYSLYRYMYLKTGRGTYKLVHPTSYGSVSLTLGQRIADSDPGPERDGTRSGVVLGHTHHGSFGFTKDGSREVVGLGCMRDPQKTKYKSMSGAHNNEWNQGFLLVLRGFFYPMWKNHTDWEFWLGSFYKHLKKQQTYPDKG